jgi:hypothetical protein
MSTRSVNVPPTSTLMRQGDSSRRAALGADVRDDEVGMGGVQSNWLRAHLRLADRADAMGEC